MGIIKKISIPINGKNFPAKVYMENRRNVRASIGKTGGILRLPLLISKKEEEKHLLWFEEWVTAQVSKKEELQNHFFKKPYRNGDILQVGDRKYLLNLSYQDRKSHNARMEGHAIYLKLAKDDTPEHLQKSIRHLLSRVIADDFLPQIVRRVNELNHLYFKQKINNIKLKYTHSRWGSCSSNGNINLSTRLLFAPEEVIDYVIIHELAHLVEPNHSPGYWKLVKDTMPDYKEKVKWLKKNGKDCDF